MPGPLDDLRVIDLSSGPVGGMATMILSDFGAEVVKIERPGGDPFRFMASAPMWLRGKKSVELDLKREVEKQRLYELVKTADVVVTAFRAHEAVDLGCDYDVLAYQNAGIVYTQISGFGPYGPYVGYPGYEGVVAAKAGRMMAFEGTAPREGPQFAALQVASHAAAQAAVTGTLAALMAREALGFGQYVETSLLQGLMSYDLAALSVASLRERQPEAWGADAIPAGAGRMPTINYQPVMAKDGKWIQLGNLLQHLFDNFVAAAEMTDIFADGKHEGSPAMWEEEVREAFRDRMFQRMREKTSDEWQEIFVANGGVVSTVFETTQDALDNPDLVMNGHVIQVHDPRGTLKNATTVMEAVLGFYGDADRKREPMKQIGPVARLTETPAEINGEIPGVGQHTRALLADQRVPWQAITGSKPRSTAPSLQGVTVLDFSTIIAAPLGCSHLADLGARVIKVEQIGGDPWRWMGNGSLGAIKTNNGKESICVDLKNEEGRKIVNALIAQADVIVHNFRPGVPERLGISYEDARALNPGIVYLNVNGYGPDGPSAHRPATHPIPGAALGGATWQSGGLPTGTSIEELREGARRLFRANEVNPDPNTSAVVATSALLGLYAKGRTGKGQEIFVDMMGANAYANADDFFWYEEREPRPEVDPDLLGTGPLYRLYRCKEGWVFLGIVLEKEWVHFCRRIGSPEMAIDPRFNTRLARQENAAALTALLEELFLTEPADDWERLLGVAGLGCVRADATLPGEFWYADEQVTVNEYKATVVHAKHGAIDRHGPVVRLRQTPNRIGPAPLAGEQTDAILAELGYTEADIERLRAANVVWAEEDVAATRP